jgi:hypothetical protein
MTNDTPANALIQPANTLRLKVGSGRLDMSAVAKAEAALKSLASNFHQWLGEEISKLEAARAVTRAEGMADPAGEALYICAHDLKGLGGTYEFPLITRLAASLCRLIEEPELRQIAPAALIDAHIDAIRASLRDDIRTDEDPTVRALAEGLEASVYRYAPPEA